MHLARASWRSANGKVYESIYLRESYREGKHVKKRNIANLTHAAPEEIAAIELALKHKDHLAALGSVQAIQLQEGPSVGAVWTVYQVAQRLGIEQALGTDVPGKLALWQVLARVLDQGSRLSAVRLAQVHAACAVLGLQRGFDENDLYANLTWLAERQAALEQRLFRTRRPATPPTLFLYDVTSTYLEGTQNALGAYGYNRDGKKGKMQLVIGLLCDEAGEPVATDVFRGNTQDLATFSAQVHTVAARFGCTRVTMVGDRGMIKSGQIATLGEAGLHYITAITKPQITTLLERGVLQLDLFETAVCEVEEAGVRYLLRRNPRRAEEMAATRRAKHRRVEHLVQQQNAYLQAHPRAQGATAQQRIQEKIHHLRLDAWLGVQIEDRTLTLQVDQAAVVTTTRLDGCYVIKTDLPPEVAPTQVVHDRYRDLALVEHAFRTCKTAHLEVRPVHVRTEPHTRGHVFVVMLAYRLRRALSRAWAAFNVTVEEGLDHLKTLCAMELQVNGGGSCLRIPTPREQSGKLLQALAIRLPEALPNPPGRVVTRKKLPERRKNP
jgi:hypothetical protein